ncbi:IS110 family transposase [Mycolicibacterium hodleri]|uniref:IS110 family transposase n=1 Tax=Mycolicibacterium hodleri TaxID=49897 RepID=A0A502EHD1_9MYCO|nr:IS110 family transposase [Mycolicibacterium hodleri]TPG36469.1 IS110 family transposase [Mycolicibacterium hodleri]
MAGLWCGIDWAEGHHDVSVVDDAGRIVCKERIGDDVAGFGRLVEMITELRPDGLRGLPIAIETAQGLLVSALRAAEAQVFTINPLAVSRYRDRYSPSRAKSDAGDAIVLANILRTDGDNHRRLPDDSDGAHAVRVLARAHQDAIWDRQQIVNKTRSLLRQYFPAFLKTFADLTTMGARTVLGLAATPAAAATLRPSTVAAALRRGGRRRGVDAEAHRIVAGLRAPHLRHPEVVEAAMGQQAHTYAKSLATVAENVATLEASLTAAFAHHPDAPILVSFPGLGAVLGARLLGEIGDDRTRFATARGLKAYAGTAPVTRASGTKTYIGLRRVRNKRLNQAAYMWALPLILHSTEARAHYDRRRRRGDSHTAASRHLANRYIGMLHHCLQTRQTYDPDKAFTPALAPANDVAC